MIRIHRGTSLLNKVVKQFDQAVADLAVAQQQIEQDRISTLNAARDLSEQNTEREDWLQYQLERFLQWYTNRNVAAEGKLYEHEARLHIASLRAQTVRQNIAKLVGAA